MALRCQSVNFNLKLNICQLLDDNVHRAIAKERTVKDSDWNYYGYEEPPPSTQPLVECHYRKDKVVCCNATDTQSCSLVKSCKEIRQGCKSCKSGFYQIFLNETKLVNVYCDMMKDGGGWMMIANVSFVNDDDRHNYVLDQVLSFDPYSLEDVKTGHFALNVSGLITANIEVAEVRFFCHKQSHGRTVDIKLLAPVMHTALTKQQQPAVYRMTRGVHFARLKGDTSRMSRVIDDLYGWEESTPFYNHRLFASHQYHWHFYEANRMDCDDFPAHTLTNKFAGTWQLFVR